MFNDFKKLYLATNRKLRIGIIAFILFAIYSSSFFAHNIILEKVFIHKLYAAPKTREAEERVRNMGLRMVSFANDPYQCAQDVQYAALLVVNPNRMEFSNDIRGWDTREGIDKNIKESCK